MAAHRKPKQRSLSGHTARTAATLALASAATATAFEGTGHAEPKVTPSEVKDKVDELYREAEVATEKYNGAKEKADKAERSLAGLRDEAARRTEKLNTARQGLGSLATAQYRTGAVDPSVQLALSSDPDEFLDRASRADRAGHRQAATVTDVRHQIRELDQLHTEADGTLDDLKSRQADLRKHKKTVTGKLAEAKRLLARLTAEERARLAADGAAGDADRASRDALAFAARRLHAEGVVLLFAVPIVGYALAYVILGERVYPSNLAASFLARPWGIYPHALFGSLALGLGALQFNRWLIIRHRPVHRVVGTVYVIAATVVGLAGLYMSVYSFGGLVTHIGFGTLAVLLLWTTARAYFAARYGLTVVGSVIPSFDSQAELSSQALTELEATIERMERFSAPEGD